MSVLKKEKKLPCFCHSCWAIVLPLLLADGGYLGISQQLSDTLQDLTRGSPIAFGHFPAAFLYPLAVQQLLIAFPSD